MLNLIQQYDMARKLSKDQLAQEIQKPSGLIAPFVLVAAGQEKSDMASRAVSPQKEGTVAESLVSRLAQLRGSLPPAEGMQLPPQSAMPPTQEPPQAQQGLNGFARGGAVKKLESGGPTKYKTSQDLPFSWKKWVQATMDLESYGGKNVDNGHGHFGPMQYNGEQYNKDIAAHFPGFKPYQEGKPLPPIEEQMKVYEEVFLPRKLQAFNDTVAPYVPESQRYLTPENLYVMHHLGEGALKKMANLPMNTRMEDALKGVYKSEDYYNKTLDLNFLRGKRMSDYYKKLNNYYGGIGKFNDASMAEHQPTQDYLNQLEFSQDGSANTPFAGETSDNLNEDALLNAYYERVGHPIDKDGWLKKQYEAGGNGDEIVIPNLEGIKRLQMQKERDKAMRLIELGQSMMNPSAPTNNAFDDRIMRGPSGQFANGGAVQKFKDGTKKGIKIKGPLSDLQLDGPPPDYSAADNAGYTIRLGEMFDPEASYYADAIRGGDAYDPNKMRPAPEGTLTPNNVRVIGDIDNSTPGPIIPDRVDLARLPAKGFQEVDPYSTDYKLWLNNQKRLNDQPNPFAGMRPGEWGRNLADASVPIWKQGMNLAVEGPKNPWIEDSENVPGVVTGFANLGKIFTDIGETAAGGVEAGAGMLGTGAGALYDLLFGTGKGARSWLHNTKEGNQRAAEAAPPQVQADNIELDRPVFTRGKPAAEPSGGGGGGGTGDGGYGASIDEAMALAQKLLPKSELPQEYRDALKRVLGTPADKEQAVGEALLRAGAAMAGTTGPFFGPALNNAVNAGMDSWGAYKKGVSKDNETYAAGIGALAQMDAAEREKLAGVAGSIYTAQIAANAKLKAAAAKAAEIGRSYGIPESIAKALHSKAMILNGIDPNDPRNNAMFNQMTEEQKSIILKKIDNTYETLLANETLMQTRYPTAQPKNNYGMVSAVDSMSDEP